MCERMAPLLSLDGTQSIVVGEPCAVHTTEATLPDLQTQLADLAYLPHLSRSTSAWCPTAPAS